MVHFAVKLPPISSCAISQLRPLSFHTSHVPSPGMCSAAFLTRFDPHPQFYREVRRILKTGGCFAAWTYGLPTLCHKGHPANAVLWELFDGVLGSYWAEGRKHVEAAYRGIEPVQGQDFTHVERLTFHTSRMARVGDLVRHQSQNPPCMCHFFCCTWPASCIFGVELSVKIMDAAALAVNHSNALLRM